MSQTCRLDPFSYQCGVIDCFNEIVAAGVKSLAMSHPMPSAAERDRYLSFSREICAQYGTCFFPEDEPLLTDLFPLSLNRGKYNILYYADPAVLERYRALKARKQELVARGEYQGEARFAIAQGFGELLSYTPEAIRRMVEKNPEKE